MIYNITYVLNGGTNNAGNEATYDDANLPVVLLDPTKTDFHFGGWFIDSDLTEPLVDSTITVAGDITVYAYWYSYSITYVLNGGTNNVSNPDTFEGTDLPLILLDPTKDGLHFRGWYTDELGTQLVDSTIAEGGDITVYAAWYALVSFDSNGGTAVETEEVSELNTASVPDPEPTRTGYTFGAWYTDEALTSAYDFETGSITADTILYASWDLVTYTITYVNENGLTNSNPTTYTIETATIVFSDLTGGTSSLVFSGWVSNLESNTEFASIPLGSTGDKVVYASWFRIGDFVYLPVYKEGSGSEAHEIHVSKLNKTKIVEFKITTIGSKYYIQVVVNIGTILPIIYPYATRTEALAKIDEYAYLLS